MGSIVGEAQYTVTALLNDARRYSSLARNYDGSFSGRSPDFSTDSVSVLAPTPTYVAPTYTDRIFAPPALSGLDVNLTAPQPIAFNYAPSASALLFGTYEISVGESIPSFVWEDPEVPDRANVTGLREIRDVTKPTDITLTDVTYVPERADVGPTESITDPSFTATLPTVTWESPTDPTLTYLGAASSLPSVDTPTAIYAPDTSYTPERADSSPESTGIDRPNFNSALPSITWESPVEPSIENLGSANSVPTPAKPTSIILPNTSYTPERAAAAPTIDAIEDPAFRAALPALNWFSPTAPSLESLGMVEPVPMPVAPASIHLPDARYTPERASAAPTIDDIENPEFRATLPALAWASPATPALHTLSNPNAAPTPVAPTAVQLPDVLDPTPVDVSNAPVWNAVVEFDTSGVPGAKPTLPPLTAPTVTIPPLPAVPEWDSPEVVVLSEIFLPTLTPLVIPDVSNVVIPSLVLPELQARLDFTDAEFDDSLVQELMAEVRAVLGGRLAIPSHIWTRIWERVAADVNRQYLARKREAQRAHAKLGWSMPGGVLIEALQVAATEINAEISAKANEIAIKQAEMQQADYWQAMQQGVALTTLLSQIHNARQERLLKAAMSALEANVAAYNAVIAAYNAEVQAVNADIETKKLQLQAELTKVEVYKTEMEGAKLGVEIDKAKVEMYIAQWTAVKTQAEAYESMVRGVQAQVEAQKAGVEAYGQQVQAQATIVQMWATEWEAYAKKLEAEKLKLGKFETEARAFESQVNGYRAWIEGQASRSNIQIEGKKLELERARIDSTRYQADWQGEQLRLGSYEAYLKAREQQLAENQSKIEFYKAQMQDATGRLQAQQGQYQALGTLIEQDKLELGLFDSRLKRAGMDVETYRAELEALRDYTNAALEVKKIEVQAAQVDVTRYQADWSGEQIRLGGYEAYLKSRDQMLAVNQNKIEFYKAQMQDATGRLQAQQGQYQALGTLVEQDKLELGLFDSRMKLVGMDIESYRAGIEALRDYTNASLEIKKIEVQAAQVDATRYQADWQGEQIKLAGYESYLKSRDQILSANQSKIEFYKAKMQDATGKLQAQQGRYQALGTLVDQDKVLLGLYDSDIKLLSVEVDAHKTNVEALRDYTNAGIEVKKLELQRSQIDAARYQSDWQGEQIKLAGYEAYLKSRDQQLAENQNKIEFYKAKMQDATGKLQARQGQYQALGVLLEQDKLELGRYDSDIKLFGTQLEAYKIDVEALRDYTSASIEAKKLELQRAQIDVQRYQADWQGEQAKIAGYEAYLKEKQLPLEAAKVNANTYQARVQGEVGRAQAWGSQYDAYQKLLQKDAVKAQLQNSYATIYGAVVDREKMFLDWAKHSSDLVKNYEMLVQDYNKSVVAEHQAEAQFQAAQLSANAQTFGIGAEIYKADVQGAVAVSQIQSEIYKASVEVSKANADISIEAAKVMTSQWQIEAQLEQSQMQANSSVYAQLGAAAYAATNASLSASYSASDVIGHSYSESVSADGGEVGVTGPWL